MKDRVNPKKMQQNYDNPTDDSNELLIENKICKYNSCSGRELMKCKYEFETKRRRWSQIRAFYY